VTIDLRKCLDYKTGEYSIVYAFQGRSYKLFRSRPEVPPRRTRAGRREIFERQREAYHVAGEGAVLLGPEA
jgi:hypothetical protein